MWFCYYKVICYALISLKSYSIGQKLGSWWRMYKAHQNNESLMNNNRPPSLSDCSQGDRKQGILLCWPKNGQEHLKCCSLLFLGYRVRCSTKFTCLKGDLQCFNVCKSGFFFSSYLNRETASAKAVFQLCPGQHTIKRI